MALQINATDHYFLHLFPWTISTKIGHFTTKIIWKLGTFTLHLHMYLIIKPQPSIHLANTVHVTKVICVIPLHNEKIILPVYNDTKASVFSHCSYKNIKSHTKNQHLLTRKRKTTGKRKKMVHYKEEQHKEGEQWYLLNFTPSLCCKALRTLVSTPPCISIPLCSPLLRQFAILGFVAKRGGWGKNVSLICLPLYFVSTSF